MACEFGQGYYFYKPLSSQAARAIIETGMWTDRPQPASEP
jgi:EAL domain-containing protein (putative c-di-GMP-specific phosphodiesterase class I)